MKTHKKIAIVTTLHVPKVWEQFVDDVCSILKRTRFVKFFDYLNSLHRNVKFTMEEKSKEELVFLDNFLKRNTGKIFVLAYRITTHNNQYLYHSFHHQISCQKSVFFSFFNKAYFIITNKDDLTKENAGIKQVLKRVWISRKHY